jgi:hypothetical protein
VATIASLLRDRVTLQIRSADRLVLHGYVPKLMCEGRVVRFLPDRGFQAPSLALLGSDRARLRQGDRALCGRGRDPGRALPQGRVEGGDGASLPQARRARGAFRRRHDRRRAGARLGLARLARRRPRRPSSLRLRAPVGVPEPLLLLSASICATRSSAPPSSRRSPTRRSRSGSTSTATGGPSARRPSRDSASRRSTTVRPPLRGPDEALAARARRRARSRLHATPDDLRPAPPAAQGLHSLPAGIAAL